MAKMSECRVPLIILAIITLLLGVIYWPGTQGGFLLDDDHNIKTATLQDVSIGSMKYMLSNNISGPTKRPVSALSFAINHHFMGGAPESYKKINIVIHAVTTLIVFAFLVHVFALAKVCRPASVLQMKAMHPGVCWAALLGSVLWAVSPMHVSTVLYAVQRMTMLATLFSLLTIILYVRARLNLAYGFKYRYWVYLTAAFICFVLAGLSKENGLLVIPLIIVLELTLLKHLAPRIPFDINAKLSRVLVGLFILSLLVAVIMAVQLAIPAYAGRSFTLTERLLSQSYVLAQYLLQLVLPYAHSLKFYYDDFIPVGVHDPRFWLSAIFWASVISVLVVYKGVHRQVLLGLSLFYLLAHSMESSFWPLEMVFEHRNYLASVGVFGLIGYGVYVVGAKKITRAPNRGAHGRSFVWPAVATTYLFVVAFYGLMLHERVSVWADDRLFARMMAIYNPNSMRANLELAKVYLKEGDIERGARALAALKEKFPNEMGFPLIEMLVLCQSDGLTQGYLRNISTIAGALPVSPLALKALQDLLGLIADGKCKNNDPDLMLDVTYQVMVNKKTASLRTGVLSHAYNLYLHRRYAEAADLFDRVLHMDSRENASKVFALYHLGIINISQGNNSAAREQLSEIQRIQGGSGLTNESISLMRLLTIRP